MTTTYSATYGSMTISLTVDLSQTSSPVIGDPEGRQVADFRHWATIAMEEFLKDFAESCGENSKDRAAQREIVRAAKRLIESD